MAAAACPPTAHRTRGRGIRHRAHTLLTAGIALALTAATWVALTGVTASPAHAIYAGTNANLAEFPWMTTVHVLDKDGWRHSCGGTLVDPSWVLTAAHCVRTRSNGGTNLPTDTIRVVVGRNRTADGWSEANAVTIGDPVFYPGAAGTPLWPTGEDDLDDNRGDIALLPLNQPVYGVPVVKLSYGEMPETTALTAVGWGSTNDFWRDANTPDLLQKIDHIRVKADAECWDTGEERIAAEQICTKANRQPTLELGGPRKGDSGGPVLLWTGGHWIQMGIASHLPRACAPGVANCQGLFDVGPLTDGDPNYTGWTSIRTYRNWITTTIGARPGGSGATVSTALVVDSSGSMGDNDPDNRRLDASHAYVTAAHPDDEISVTEFDDTATVLTEAVRVGTNRTRLTDAINTIDSGGGTDLGAGLDAGCGTLQRATGRERAAIFLTDGDGAYNNNAACYTAAGWRVFTIGLGAGVNGTLLEQIATTTGGDYLQLNSSTNLVCQFQQIRARIAGEGTTDCTPSGTITQDQRITRIQPVATQLAQVTFTNTWLGSDIEMSVTTPTGRIITRDTTTPGVVVTTGATFETFTITDPEPGNWTVEFLGTDIPDGGEPFTYSVVELPLPDNELDTDEDGVTDPTDNCAYLSNPNQADTDGDGTGDVCEDDQPNTTGPVTSRGTVIRIVDGDTFQVRLTTGHKPLVDLVGVTAPGPRACGTKLSTRSLRNLLPPRTKVVLTTDTTQPRSTTHGHLLRYVTTRGHDAGRVQLDRGWVKLRPKTALDALTHYRAAQRSARKAGRGLWGLC